MPLIYIRNIIIILGITPDLIQIVRTMIVSLVSDTYLLINTYTGITVPITGKLKTVATVDRVLYCTSALLSVYCI